MQFFVTSSLIARFVELFTTIDFILGQCNYTSHWKGLFLLSSIWISLSVRMVWKLNWRTLIYLRKLCYTQTCWILVATARKVKAINALKDRHWDWFFCLYRNLFHTIPQEAMAGLISQCRFHISTKLHERKWYLKLLSCYECHCYQSLIGGMQKVVCFYWINLLSLFFYVPLFWNPKTLELYNGGGGYFSTNKAHV